jgi:hypothetical protein
MHPDTTVPVQRASGQQHGAGVPHFPERPIKACSRINCDLLSSILRAKPFLTIVNFFNGQAEYAALHNPQISYAFYLLVRCHPCG